MADEKGETRKNQHQALASPKGKAEDQIITSAAYRDLLDELKARIRTAQVKAALAVNQELILLYWQIGAAIVERQNAEGWGKAVVERLSADLQREFPGIAGFSPANIWRMRAFHRAWPPELLAQAVRENENAPKLAQPVRDPEPLLLDHPISQIPWGHNVILMEKLKNPEERLWYARQTTENGWSRAMLIHWIQSDLYARQGKAVTNFRATLPAPQSDLAVEMVHDPYNFDFITLQTDAPEHDLERGLLDHISKFLLELGTGFAFVGRQVHLEVDGEDFYLDLLFYHLQLRCFVVIELKTGAFKPEHAGKMNFYLSAVDDHLRHPGDEPSIGIILCKTRSRIIAEYALRHLARPVGVARYETRLVEALPTDLKDKLPSVEQIQAELSGAAAQAGKRRSNKNGGRE